MFEMCDCKRIDVLEFEFNRWSASIQKTFGLQEQKLSKIHKSTNVQDILTSHAQDLSKVSKPFELMGGSEKKYTRVCVAKIRCAGIFDSLTVCEYIYVHCILLPQSMNSNNKFQCQFLRSKRSLCLSHRSMSSNGICVLSLTSITSHDRECATKTYSKSH